MKTFASYLFRHSQKEISPICHVTNFLTKIKLLHLLVPVSSPHSFVPLIWSFQILDIAIGLKNLHDFDIIHGDLRAVCDVLSHHSSQSFILFQTSVLYYDGHCYLADFGISIMSAMTEVDDFAQLVNSGWAAPELDQQPRSKQSDIFSFACTIYEVLVYFLVLLSLFTYLCS